MALKSIPVDLSALSGLVVMTPPEPKIDPTTKDVKRDRDGQPIWLVGVSVRKIGSREADVLDVSITSALVDIVEGAHVRLIGLEATPWNMEGRAGVSYKAAGIEVVPGRSGVGAGSGGGAAQPESAAGRSKTAGGGS